MNLRSTVKNGAVSLGGVLLVCVLVGAASGGPRNGSVRARATGAEPGPAVEATSRAPDRRTVPGEGGDGAGGAERDSSTVVSVHTDDRVVHPGERFRVPVRVTGLGALQDNIHSYQFDVDFSAPSITLEDVRFSGTLTEKADFTGDFDIRSGDATIGAFGRTPLDSVAEEGVLVTLEFAAHPEKTVSGDVNLLDFTFTDPVTPDLSDADAHVTVTPNRAPEAVPDTFRTVEDSTLEVEPPGVLAEDADPDGDSLRAELVSGPTHGTLTLEASGAVRYAPAPNFNGPDRVRYRAVDPKGAADTATVRLDVAAVNDAPTIEAPADTTIAEDDTTSVGVAVRDVETAPEALSVSAAPSSEALLPPDRLDVRGPDTTGSAVLAMRPAPDSSGTTDVTVTVEDEGGRSASVTFTLTVRAVNDRPTLSPIADTTVEEDGTTGPIEFALRDAESRPADLDLSATSSNPALVPDDSVRIGSTGAVRTVTATPRPDSNGTATLSVTATDAQGAETTETFTLTVRPVNDAPVAVPDTFEGRENRSLSVGADDGVLAGDTDVDGDSLTAALVADVSHGTLRLRPDGAFTYDPADFFGGTDAFVYEVSDGHGGTDRATATLRIQNVNHPPVATADTFHVVEDSTLTAKPPGVLTEDADPDGDSLRAELVSGPAHGTLTLEASGAIRYAPAPNFNGTDRLRYRAVDPRGAADTAAVELRVAAVNDAPTIEAPADTTIAEDASTSPMSVAVGDVETDPEDLTVTARSDAPALVPDDRVTVGGTGAVRTVTVTPRPDSNGRAPVAVTVGDGDAQTEETVVVTVEPVPDPPTASDDTVSTAEGRGLSVAAPGVLAGDADPDGDALTVEAVQGAVGNVGREVRLSSGAVVRVKADGSFVYAPNAAFDSLEAGEQGRDRFTYAASDGNPETADATGSVHVELAGTNDAPTINALADTTIEEGSTAGPIWFTVGDPETDPAELDVTVRSDRPALVPNENIERSGPEAGGRVSLSVEPRADSSGTAPISVTVADGQGKRSTESFVVTVEPVNDPPRFVAVPADTTIRIGTSYEAQFRASDPEGTPVTYSALRGLPEGAVLEDSTGRFVWRPSPRQRDSTYQIAVKGSDGRAHATATVALTVTAEEALVQFVHNAADPAARTIDVYVGGKRQIDDFEFRSATPFVPVPAGVEVELGVARAPSEGPADILHSQTVAFEPDSTYTVVANGVLEPARFAANPAGKQIGFEFFVVPDAKRTAPAGQVRLRVVHGATDAPALDGTEGGRAWFDDVAYGEVAGTLSVEAEKKRVLLTKSDTDERLGTFEADVSGMGGRAMVVLASGFLGPTNNQDGASLQLVGVRPTGEVSTFARNRAPIVAASLPDDTIEVSAPPLRLAGLPSLFRDPDGDALSIRVRSRTPSVLSVADEEGAGPVALVPESIGTATVEIAATDGTAEASTEVSVRARPDDGHENPVRHAVAPVDTVGGPPSVQFGDVGVAIAFAGGTRPGWVRAARFDSGPSGREGISESNVSRARLVLRAGAGLDGGDSTEVRMRADAFGDVEQPSRVTVYRRPTVGTGQFTPLPTTVDENGTPDAPSDDRMVARVEAFGEFVLASDAEPLPVELAGLEARVRGGSTVVLTWTTLSETNNAGFRVHHQPPGSEHWDDLAFVGSKARGDTTTETTSYRYRADGLGPGAHRFRLEQVDLDGSTVQTEPVTAELRMEQALRLDPPTPNPVSSTAVVSFAVTEAVRARVVLYNLLGRRVRVLYRGTPTPGESRRLRLDAATLPSGPYVLRLEAAGRTVHERVTVVR